MNRGLLIIISGPSAVGKGTVCGQYLKMHQEAAASVSATTRLPRAGEVDGESYYFTSKEAFMRDVEQDRFLEHAIVHQKDFYGTPKKAVEEQLEEGKDVILEIDVQGALQLKEKNIDGLYIFVSPPTLATLKQRILRRGTENQEQIEIRMSIAEKEMALSKEYDYIIINDVLDQAVKELERIIAQEKAKRGILQKKT